MHKIGTMEQWYNGTMLQWYNGMVRWYYSILYIIPPYRRTVTPMNLVLLPTPFIYI